MTDDETLAKLRRLTQDLNERDAELREHKRFCTGVFDDLPLAVLVIEPLSGIVKAVNRAFAQMTGFTEAEVIGTWPPYPWLPAEQVDKCEQWLGSMTHDSPQTRLTPGVTKDGDPLYLEVTGILSEPIDGERLCLLCWYDVTRQREAERALRCEPGTILIVEDDPDCSKMLTDTLEREGYDVYQAHNFSEAEAVIPRRPAVALIDLRLPGANGIEVGRMIRERSPGTRCIVLTAYSSQRSAVDAVNLGFVGYFQKPYNVSDLLAALKDALTERRTGRETH